jgi:hypothetical protein
MSTNDRAEKVLRVGRDVVKLELENRPPDEPLAVEVIDHRGRLLKYNLRISNKGRARLD